VSSYSNLNLMFPSDKLQALSGVAEIFHSRNAKLGRYLAGLWEETLIENLF
jgi:hypothetical protein